MKILSKIFIILIIFHYSATGKDLKLFTASLKTAKMLERKGDIEGAIAIYEDILSKNPNDYTSTNQFKSLLRKHRKFSEGIILLEKILINKPSDIKTYVELGEFYFLDDQLHKAKDLWKNGFELFKNNQSYYRLIITVYGRFGLDNEIDYLLIEGRKIFGQTFLTHEASIYYQNRNVFDKAMDEYIIQIVNDLGNLNSIQRRILNMSDEDGSAPIIEKKLLNAFNNNTTKISGILSAFYFKRKEYQQSFNIRKKWSTNDETNHMSWLKFAEDLRKEYQFSISIDSYNYLLNQEINKKLTAKALMGLAKVFEDQITPIRQTNLIPYFYDNNKFFYDPFQINASISQNNLEKSLVLYDSLLTTLPQSKLLSGVYFRLGEIQFQILQDFDSAKLFYQSVLDNKPDKDLREKTILRLADVYISKGQPKQALTILNDKDLSFKSPEIEDKIILISYLTEHPDSTLNMIQNILNERNPTNPSFNDLMQLKNILTKYYLNGFENKDMVFKHFQKAENLIKQNKVGESIQELKYLTEEFPKSAIFHVAILRQALLHYRLNQIDEAIIVAKALDGSTLSDKAAIFIGQIYETKLFEIEKALSYYMKIINEYPESIFAEPIRYHIRNLKDGNI